MNLSTELKQKIANAVRAMRFPSWRPQIEADYERVLAKEWMTKGAEMALESQWVDCKDRMPGVKKDVLIFTGNNVTSAILGDNGYWYAEDSFGYSIVSKVTHWQALPQPPTT